MKPAQPAAVTVAAAPADLDRIPADGSRLVVATGHQGEVRRIVATPDGRFVATLADDRIARVFAADGLRELARFYRPGLDPQAIALAGDGARVAVAYGDGVVISDVATGAELGRIAGPTLDTCLVFDGEAVLAWRAGLVRWQQGAPLAKLAAKPATCIDLGFVGPTTLVVHDGEQLWRGELPAWTPVAGPQAPSGSIAFATGLVAWGARDGIYVWRTTSGAATRLASASDARVAVVDDGAAVIASTGDATTRIEVATGATTKLDDRELVAPLRTGAFVFANEHTLCTGDAKTGATLECLAPTTGPVRSLAVAGGELIVGADEAPLRAWSLGYPTAARRFGYSTYAPSRGAAALAPDGKRSAQIDHHGIVVRPVAGDQRRELRHAPGAYHSVAWTPDGAWVATLWNQSVVRMRADGNGHEVIKDVIPKRAPPRWVQQHGEPDAFVGEHRWRDLAYRPDGAVLAIAADDKVVLVRGGQAVAALAGPTAIEAVTAIAWHGNDLAVGFADGHVRTWDTERPAAPPRDRAIGAPISALAFAGGTLLVAADDGKLRIGESVVDTHAPTALAIASLPDDRIATGHVDGVVRIWHGGTLAAELYPLGARAQGRSDWLVARSDGAFEASLDGDGSTFYGVKAGKLVDIADRRRAAVLEAALVDHPPRRAAPGPTVVPQLWTTASLHSLVFTADGKELIGKAEDGVYAFDVDSGLVRARLAGGGGELQIAASTTAIYRVDNGLEALDRTTGHRIAARPGITSKLVGRTPAGELVIAAYDGIEVWSETPLRRLRAQPTTDLAVDSALALAPDGSVIAATKADGSVLAWTTATLAPRPPVRCTWDKPWHVALSAGAAWIACATSRGTIAITGASGAYVVRPDAYSSMQTVYGLAFHPTRPLLAAATLTGAYLYDVERRSELRLAGREGRYDTVAWSPDGSVLAVSELGGAIHLYDASGAALRTLEHRVAKVDRIARARPGVLVVREAYHLRTWDAATGHERPFDGGAKQYAHAWLPDGSAHAVVEGGNAIVVTDATGAKTSIAIAGALGGPEIELDGKRVYAAVQRDKAVELGAYDIAAGTPAWKQVVDGTISTLARAPTGELGMIVRSDKLGQVGADYRFAVVGPDGKPGAVYAASGTTYLTDALGLPGGRWLLAESKHVVVWSGAAAGQATIPAKALALSPDGKRVVVTSDHELFVLDAKSLGPQANASEPDATLSHSVWLTDEVIATLVDDGTITLWRVQDGMLARAGRLIARPGHGMVLVSPEGYYMAEAEAASSLGFALGPQVFRFEQFDGALNRPHRALAALGIAPKPTLDLYEAAYDKRARGRGDVVTTATRLLVPTIELVDALPLRATTDKLAVKLRADGKRTAIARINVRVNGVPLLGRTGLDVRAKRLAVVDHALDVPLEVGTNRIELEAENEQGVLALGRTIVVTRDGTPKPGTLHVISIGVSKYKAGNDLQYAAKDADDVAGTLAKLGGTAVTRTVLRDDQATRGNILALRKQLEQTAIEDTVVMFVAGHGLLDDADQYVFGTHEVDFETGARGLAFAELEGLLDGIPARRRVLLIDTCHAGEVDAEELAYVERSEREGKRGVHRVKVRPKAPKPSVDPRARAVAARELFTEVRRGSGVTVLAASAGAEYSYEDSAIKNGLFSHALIDALGGKADRDRNGAVIVSELVDYLTAAVAQQTQGFQVPQARELNRDLDFDLTPGRPHTQPWTFDKCIGMGAPATYQCGALVAMAAPSTPGLAPGKALDKLVADLAPFMGTLRTTWSDNHGLGVKTARKLVASSPGYKLDAIVGWIAVDATTGRTAACFAIDGIPAAAERCKRVMPALLAQQPPQELPD